MGYKRMENLAGTLGCSTIYKTHKCFYCSPRLFPTFNHRTTTLGCCALAVVDARCCSAAPLWHNPPLIPLI